MLDFNQIDKTKLLQLINDTYEAIKPAKGKNPVLFIGGTGAGKSTLLNYLFGSKLSLKEDESEESLGGCTAALEENETEYFKMGKGNTSETLFPQTKELSYLPLAIKAFLTDCAGWPDNRGTVESICAANSVEILSKSVSQINGLVLVAEWGSISTQKGELFFEKVKTIAKVMKNKLNDVNQSVALIITKTDGKKLSPKIIENNITSLIEREKKKTNLTELEKNTIKVLEQLRDSQKLVADITDQKEESRKNMMELIKNLKPLDTKDLDFSEVVEDQTEFKKGLIKAAHHYLESVRAWDEKKNNLVTLQKEERDHKQNLEKLKLERHQFDEGRTTKIQNLNLHKRNYKEQEDKIEELNSAVRKSEGKIKELSNLTTYNYVVGGADWTSTAQTSRFSTGDKPKHEGKNWFKVISRNPIYSNVQLIKPRKGVRKVDYTGPVEGNDKYPIHNINNFPVQLQVSDYSNINVINNILIGANSSCDLSYPLSAHCRLSYKLAGQEKDHPTNMKAISSEGQNIEGYKTKIKEHEKEQGKIKYTMDELQNQINTDTTSIKVGEHNISIELLEQKEQQTREQIQILNSDILNLSQVIEHNRNSLDILKELVTTLKLEEEPTIKTFLLKYNPQNRPISIANHPNSFLNNVIKPDKEEIINDSKSLVN
ncbi:TPA: hypothetical protein ACGWTM_001741 [Legionella pneumophila]